jgi:predicted RNA binding protein YcfA (HicA-like mRNA interferase family)
MSTRLPSLKPKAVLAALKRGGFFVHHVSGSHYVLKHPDRVGLRVTLPMHNRDMKRGTLASILDQAGLSVEGFLALLGS